MPRYFLRTKIDLNKKGEVSFLKSFLFLAAMLRKLAGLTPFLFLNSG